MVEATNQAFVGKKKQEKGIPSMTRGVKHYLVTSLMLLVLWQDPNNVERSRALERQGMAAYQKKDFALAASLLREALDLRPTHPTLIYNLAAVHALGGDTTEPINLLGKIGRMGLAYSPEKDSDFVSLFDHPAFRRVVETFRENRVCRKNAIEVLSIAERGLLTEGIAYDPADGSYYFGSIRKRKIVRVHDGDERSFSQERDSLLGVFGMAVDNERRVLWACTAALPEMSGYRPEMEGKTSVVKYDLQTGRHVRTYHLPGTEGNHLFGDLTLDPNGTVYISDSNGRSIFRITQTTDQIELFVGSHEFVSPQGLAFSPGGDILYLADYSRGIFAIEMNSRTVRLLPTPANTTLMGIDGLYEDGGMLIGVQNGVSPNRIISITLSQDGRSLKDVGVLENNNPDFDEPTLGTIHGGQLFFIGNSQWSRASRTGVSESDWVHHRLYRLELGD